MLTEFFYWVLNSSIFGSIAGLFVLVARQIKPVPKFAVYLLWAVPFIRFFAPLGVANPYSLLSLLSQMTTKTVAVYNGVTDLTTTNFVMQAGSYAPFLLKTNRLDLVFGIAAGVWLIFAVMLLVVTSWLYRSTKLVSKTAVLKKENIYYSNQVSAPAVYGILHPKIILPQNTAKEDTEYILKHERVHMKRKDNLFRLIAIVTACVHWFNPLSWVFLKYFLIDMELACDARVLRECSDKRKKEYASVMLRLVSSGTAFASGFGGTGTKIRIKSILSYKKLTGFSTVLLVVFIIAIAFSLLTNAAL